MFRQPSVVIENTTEYNVFIVKRVPQLLSIDTGEDVIRCSPIHIFPDLIFPQCLTVDFQKSESTRYRSMYSINRSRILLIVRELNIDVVIYVVICD